jgi:hypothetical protein
MPISLFDWLNILTQSKDDWDSFSDEDKESFNPYMIHRYVSMKSEYIDLVNIIQTLPNDKRLIYLTYKSLLPKNKVWFKYIKNTNKEINKELTDKIAEYFVCSTREAKDYIEILEKEKILSILGELGINEKEIKKLTK